MLLATTNPGKIREIRKALQSTPVEIQTLNDVGSSIPEPEETGRTFAENARLKACYYARATGLVTVAEDSGLAIDALDGRPGVESARYPGATYPDKFHGLYRELAGHRRPWRARYVSAIAVVEIEAGETAVLFEAEGVVEGEVAPAPRGSNGFGYDPIFYYPPFGATFGEIDDAKKLEVSHRGRAFRQVAAWLGSRPFDRVR